MVMLPRPRRTVVQVIPWCVTFGFLLVVGCISWRVAALAPPHPEWKDYENVFQMRQRLNITYNYTPRHYPAEHCRYKSEEDCRKDDESAARAVGRRQNLMQEQRHLNPSESPSMKMLVLLMYFPEHESIKSNLPPVSYFDELLNGVGTSAVNPAGSMKEFLYVNSLRKFNVEFVIQDWTMAKESEEYYANGISGRGDMARIEDIFRSKLEEMDATGFDWSPFDANMDGYLDGVMTFHSGIPAELGPAKCAAPIEQRIWAQAVRGAIENGWMSSSGLFLLDAFTVSGAFTRPLCDDETGGDGTGILYTPTTMAIACHELGHTWQLEDYYDQTPGETGVAGIGAYDIMCQAYGWKFDGARPGYYSAYNKIKSGWMTPTNITQDGYYVIQPLELSGQAYIISDPFPEGEYLLIESRFPYRWSSDWDGKGIVIYHVDEKAPLQSARGYPGKSGWPAQHYRVAVLQKDGMYDIENNVNLGDATDFWLTGDVLGPGPDTWPNTDSIQGSQTQTGLSITITSTVSPGSYFIQFQVSGLQKWSGAPAAFAPNLDANAVSTKSLETVSKKSSAAGSSFYHHRIYFEYGVLASMVTASVILLFW